MHVQQMNAHDWMRHTDDPFFHSMVQLVRLRESRGYALASWEQALLEADRRRLQQAA